MIPFDNAHRAVHYPPDRRFRIWIRPSVLTILILLVLSRCCTPAEMNVNLAFETWSFARAWIPGLTAHLLSMLAIWATGLFVAERLLRIVAPPRCKNRC